MTYVLFHNLHRDDCPDDIWHFHLNVRRQFEGIRAKGQIMNNMGTCNERQEVVKLFWWNVYPGSQIDRGDWASTM